MKVIYVLLVCALVIINSAFALPKEEGPFGEDNASFCLKKETVIEHFKSPHPRKPLVIKGHKYNLLGSITGKTGEDFRADPSIQWIVFKNYAPSHLTPCKDWSYFLQLHFSNKVDAVNLDIHKVKRF